MEDDDVYICCFHIFFSLYQNVLIQCLVSESMDDVFVVFIKFLVEELLNQCENIPQILSLSNRTVTQHPLRK